MSSSIVCNSCDQPKHNLEHRKSKVTKMDIFICRTCIDLGYEPRQLLIIAYYSGAEMRDRATKYIKNGLYLGKTIALNEVL
jgi:hypothetical protein